MIINQEVYNYPLINGITGFFQDKEVFRELNEESECLMEKRFSVFFNENPVSMIIYTLKGGRFVEVNNSFLRITGYCREEVVGRTTTDLNLWLNSDDCKKINQTLLDKGTVINREIFYCTKSGRERVGLVSANIFDPGGEQYILVVLNDITEFKQLKKKMTRYDRMNLVGKMATGIGHEIRNPMTTVRGFLQLLDGKKEFKLYKDYFSLMISEVDRADSIIRELLLMAPNKAVDLKRLNLNHIVRALYPIIRTEAIITEKNISVEIGDVPDLLLDEKDIRQLILNLSRNGLEAMCFGGTLTIRTFKDGEDAVLSVQDQGRGISLEILEKIGTPFFTTKEMGTGLGLAVCYSIAARHNADIKIETGPAGTTFFTRFSI